MTTQDKLRERASEVHLGVAPPGGVAFAEAVTIEEAEHQRTLARRITGQKELHIVWLDTGAPVTRGEAEAMRGKTRSDPDVRSCEGPCRQTMDEGVNRVRLKDGRRVCPFCWTKTHPSQREHPA